MAFGQSSGPPATGRQLNELSELLSEAGHSDFRDARGPMGFNQRQAGGKFTQDEADAFIKQLQDELYSSGPPPGSTPPTKERTEAKPASRSQSQAVTDAVAAKRKRSATRARKLATNTSDAPELNLRDLPAEALAAELQRRGWVVLEP